MLSSAGATGLKIADHVREASIAEMALHQWPDRSGLPDAGSNQLDDQTLAALKEEASKQAQTRYLAAKWQRPTKTVREYVNLAWEEARKREGLDPELIIAIMQKESSLSPKAQSRYGAQGLMQVVPRWHRKKLRPSESLFDPKVNVRVGAEILAEYLESADGSVHHALTKYSGNAKSYASRVLQESRKLARVAEKAAATALANTQS